MYNCVSQVIGIAFFLFHFVLWLVQKTRTILLTNQTDA